VQYAEDDHVREAEADQQQVGGAEHAGVSHEPCTLQA
jgi:hypothetical protein